MMVEAAYSEFVDGDIFALPYMFLLMKRLVQAWGAPISACQSTIR